MIWFWKAEVFTLPDYGPASERCRNHNIDGIFGDVRREDPEAAPLLFFPYICLVLRHPKAKPPLDGAQGFREA
jgi:hypothetical protein